MQDRSLSLIATLVLLLGLWANQPALASGSPSEVSKAKEAPSVVVSISPFHALVSAVMQDIGEPKLLLRGNASPHHYSLRPSEIRILQEAEIVFWGGPSLETFLVKPLQNLGSTTLTVELNKTPGLTLLNTRRSAFFPSHTHSNNNSSAHHHNSTADKHSNHDKEMKDMHFWLDPTNAKRLIDYIAQQLIIKDPQHQSQYLKNAKTFKKKLEELDQKIEKRMQVVQHQPFITFHDAYQYFEHHYHLKGVGSISLHPEVPLSVERLKTIRQIIKTTKAVCVFSEPQFKPSIVNTIVQDTQIKASELDPIGKPSSIPGAGYLKLLDNVSEAMIGCLQSQPNN